MLLPSCFEKAAQMSERDCNAASPDVYTRSGELAARYFSLKERQTVKREKDR